MQDNEIIINCLKTVKGTFDNYIKENRNINIVGKDLTIKEIRGENLAQIGFNGYYYLIIVPDSLIHDIEKEDRNLRNTESNSIYFDFPYNLVVTTKEMTDQKFYDDLCNFIIKEEKSITDEINGEEEEYTMEISLGMLILVYGIYFIATDVQFNRNINEAIR